MAIYTYKPALYSAVCIGASMNNTDSEAAEATTAS